jgi:hypothetical protein
VQARDKNCFPLENREETMTEVHTILLNGENISVLTVAIQQLLIKDCAKKGKLQNCIFTHLV